jgi:hypothetical protein
MSENSKHVVLGAGPLGIALARMLAAAGNDTQLFGIMSNPSYDMPGSEPDSVDGSDLDQMRQVCTDAGVITLCLNAHHVDWYELFPPRLEVAGVKVRPVFDITKIGQAFLTVLGSFLMMRRKMLKGGE